MLEKTDFRSKFAQDLYKQYFGETLNEEASQQEIDHSLDAALRSNYLAKETEDSDIMEIPEIHHKISKKYQYPSYNINKYPSYDIIDAVAAHSIKPAQQEVQYDLAEDGWKLKPTSIQEAVALVNHRGVVGEEKLIALLFLAIGNHISAIVEGYSGSGKTYIADNVLKFIQPGDMYRMELSSKMAAFYDADRINKANLIYVPELQKALSDKKSPLTEMVKTITEGRDSIRITTNDSRNGTDTVIVTKDKHFICTVAIENYFKMDAELSRRFLRLRTDDSLEHIQQIHDNKAKRRMFIDTDQQYYDTLEQRLDYHLAEVRKLDKIEVLDPFASYIQDFIPKTQKSVSYVNHYYGLVDASTKFHYHDRESMLLDGQRYLIANLEDHYLVHTLYFNQFQDTLFNFTGNTPNSNPEALQRIIDWKKCFVEGYEALHNLPASYERNIQNWKQRQITDNSISVNAFPNGEHLRLATFD